MENLLKNDLDHILDNTLGLWEEIRGRSIFITGGTGFFGCWLLESFVYADEKFGLDASATVLTRNPEVFKRKAPHLASHPAIKLYVGDVKSFRFPKEVFSHIIHASNEAADYVGDDDAGGVKDAIIQAARHVLEFARRCDGPKLLFTSSGSVYGPQPDGMSHIPETYEGLRQASSFRGAHGEGKFAAETLCAEYAERYGIAARIARCFTFLGPYMPLGSNYAVGNFIRNVLNDEPILVRGDGTPCRSYLYAADLSIWLWTILFRGVSCRPYNVGSADEITIADVAGIVADVSHSRHPVRIMQAAARGKAAERYVPSVFRAQSELALKQDIGLKEAVRRTLNWYLGHYKC